MNGPIPTINVMLSDVASINPSPRSSFSGSFIVLRLFEPMCVARLAPHLLKDGKA